MRSRGVLDSEWGLLIAVLAMTAITYHGVVANSFVLDDTHTVADNPAVHSLTLTHVKEWFSSPHAASGMREYASYRPILVASYALDYALWGPSAAGFHVTNLLVHLGVVVLVFLLGRRLAREPWMALCAAGIFALHPINAEAVNYVTARSSSLMTLAVLGAIWASEQGEMRGHRPWRALALLLGAAALGTKEAAVVLPVLVIAWRRAAHGDRESWAVAVRRSAEWWILVAVYLGVRMWVLAGLVEPSLSGPGVTVGQNVLFTAKIYIASLGHWLWPRGLAVDHAWPLRIGGGEAAALLGALAGALAGTVLLFRRDAQFGWCAAWFWIGIVPAGALGWISRLALYQDNRVYLAGAGLAWIAGHLVAVALRWTNRRIGLRAAAAIVLVVAVGFAARADASRTAVWSNRGSLWDDVLDKYPSSLMAHNGKGMEAFESGRFEEARDWFERSVRLSPGFAEGQKNLGVAYARLGEWDRAIAALELSLSITPRYTEALINLGKVYEHVNRRDLALQTYDRILRYDPDHAAVLGRTAWLLEQAGDLQQAAQRYQRAVAADRADREAAMSYGVVLLRLQRWEEAEDVFKGLTNQDPSFYPAQFDLGTALEGSGQWERAVDAYRRAAILNATDPDPLFRIGVLLSKQGRWQDASAAYDDALARDPAHLPTHMNLGILAERLGQTPQAIAHYEAVLSTPAQGPGDEAVQTGARDAIVRLHAGGRTGR